MIEIAMPTATATTRVLVDRIAVGDRAAFRSLYALLSRRIWRAAVKALSCPVDARAATRSTFVEVWRMARYHTNEPVSDLHEWVAAVAAGQIGDRLRTLDAPRAFLHDYDRHVHCELTELLGPRLSNAAKRPRNLRPRPRPQP